MNRSARRRLLRPHVDRELELARCEVAARDWPATWRRLERAHILSQPSATLHTRVHWVMLGVAVRQRHMGEVVGQLARLVLAPVGSLAGRYPRGNTGRSDVSMFAPMELPPDLAHALDAVR